MMLQLRPTVELNARIYRWVSLQQANKTRIINVSGKVISTEV
jgi:hypothetical protein